MVRPEVRAMVQEKAHAMQDELHAALLRVHEERQDNAEWCAVPMIQAMVDLIEAIEAICPSISRLVRDIKRVLETNASTEASRPIPAHGSSSPSTPPSATSSEDPVPERKASLGSPRHDNGRRAGNTGSSEMAMGADQTQGGESSSFPTAGSDFDAMLRRIQSPSDTTSPQIDPSAPDDSQIPAHGSSSPPAPLPSTWPEDHISRSEVLSGSPRYQDGPTANDTGASEMGMGAGQAQEEEWSSLANRSDHDAIWQRLQSYFDSAAPPVDRSASDDSQGLLSPSNQGSESLLSFETNSTRSSGHMADTRPGRQISHSMDTEDGANVTAPPGSSALDGDMDMRDLSSSVDNQALRSTPPAYCQADGDDGNVAAQPDPLQAANSASNTDVNMSDLLSLFPQIADTDGNQSLSIPSPDSVCRWPMNNNVGENANAQSDNLPAPANSASGTDVNMSDISSLVPNMAGANSHHPPTPMPSPDPACRWPMNNDVGENATAQSDNIPDIDMNMSDWLDLSHIADTNPSSLLFPVRSSGQIDRRPVNDEDGENAGAQAEPPLSPAHSTLGMDVDSANEHESGNTSDSSEFVFDSREPAAMTPDPPMATSEALDQIQFALEKGDLQGLPIKSIPYTASFDFPWGNIDGTVAQSLFKQLSCPDSAVGDEAVDYLSRRLTSSKVWIGKWSQRDQLQLSQRCILVVSGDAAEWSLVEIQPDIGTVIHYTCTISSADHEGCHYCQGAIDVAQRLLGRAPKSASAWTFQAEVVANQYRCDALLLPWTMCLRAEGKDPRLPIPADYHLTLVKKLLAELKAAYGKSRLLQENMPGDPGTSAGQPRYTAIEKYWIDYGRGHGYELRLWEKVQELVPSVEADDKLGKASDLMLMTFCIASPEALMTLQGCIEQLRSRLRGASCSYNESPRGEFEALNCHFQNDDLSALGQRIGLVRLHNLRKRYKKRLEKVLGITSALERARLKEMLKSRKGSYWNHIVDHAAQGNLNILCLLPSGDAAEGAEGPTGTRLNANDYRDLQIRNCKLLGELLEEFRPGVISSVSADLWAVLFFLKDPLGHYPLEQFSATIMEQDPSSRFFREALVLQRG